MVEVNLMEASADISSRIELVLERQWDPIGIADIREAAGEYTAYVQPIARLLQNRTSARSLAARLLDIETRRMGLPGNADRAERAARALLALTRT
jgi:hypothetical protein